MENKKPAVVRFTEGANNNVVSDIHVGQMGGDGLVFEGESHSNTVTGFSVDTSNLSIAIELVKSQLSKYDINEQIKNEIIAKIDELKIAKDKASLFERYKSLMELVDTHISVLGPVYNGIKSLWDLF
ncbi:hypothetical protein [Serratia marcescens]|uniref:hypothetical protein n=1 Tax=Serratia marcescens TaxID=615 RepID=UPI0039E31779